MQRLSRLRNGELARVELCDGLDDFPPKPQIPASIVLMLVLFLSLNGFAHLAFQNGRELDGRPSSFQSQYFKEIDLRLVTDERKGRYQSSSHAELISSLKLSDRSTLSKSKVRVEIVWPAGAPVPKLGQQIRARGRITSRGFTNSDYYLYRQGLTHKFTLESFELIENPHGIASKIYIWRSSLLNKIDELSHNERAKTLFFSLLFGDKSDSALIKKSFSDTGLSHLLAVSGTHLGLIAALVALVAYRVSNRYIEALLVVLVSTLFCIITGVQPSTLRALFLLTGATFLKFSDRRTDRLHLLALVAIVLMLGSPVLALSLGFQLSVLSVFGIIIFFPFTKIWIKRFFPYLPKGVISLFSISVVAQAITSVITLPTFKTLSLVSPFANLIAVPLCSLILYIGASAVFLGFFSGFAQDMLIKLSLFLCARMVRIVEGFSQVSWATLMIEEMGILIAVAITAFLLTLYLWWPSPKIYSQFSSPFRLLGYRVLALAVLFGTVVLLLFPSSIDFAIKPFWPESYRQEKRDGIYVLDVGQGDSTLVISDGRSALIDAGPKEEDVYRELKKLNIKSLDYLIFTHTHSDHMQGAFGFERRISVGEIVVAEGAQFHKGIQSLSRRLNSKVSTILDDSILEVGEFKIECMGPDKPVVNSSDNANSLVFFIDDNPNDGEDLSSALITGDAEADAVYIALVDENPLPKIDVLRVGHHGAAKSLNDRILEMINPKLAVFSVGKDNDYGHPKPRSLYLLNQHNIPHKRTDQLGTIYLGPTVELVAK